MYNDRCLGVFQPASRWITTLNCTEFSLCYFHRFPLVWLGLIHHLCIATLRNIATCQFYRKHAKNIATFHHGPIPSAGLIANVGQDLFQSILVIAPPELKFSRGSHYNPLGPCPQWNEGEWRSQSNSNNSQSVNSMQPPWIKAKLLCKAPDHHWSSLSMIFWGQKQCQLQHVTTCYNMLQHVTTCYNMLQHVTTCYNMLQHVTTCYSYNISLFPSLFQAWKTSHLCRPSLAASLFALAVLATYFTALVCSSVKTWAALSSLAGYREKMAVGSKDHGQDFGSVQMITLPELIPNHDFRAWLQQLYKYSRLWNEHFDINSTVLQHAQHIPT